MNSDFADTLKDLRGRSGLSLSAVARRANCSKSEVGHAETGFRLPSDQVVSGLDRALGADGMLIVLADAARAEQRRLRAARQRRSDIVLRLDLGGREVVMSLDRRSLIHGGAAYVVAAFGLTNSAKQLITCHTTGVLRSSLSLSDVLRHLPEQWHELVKADNQLGPQAAIPHVLNQLSVLKSMLPTARQAERQELIRLGAQYAESLAWLYEDLGEIQPARRAVNHAAEWAFEVGDLNLVAWTMYRRSQQAFADHDSGHVIGLAQAIMRDDARLPNPMRAAVRVQEALGHALERDINSANAILDEAHKVAVAVDTGDARCGHGSFCTPSYIEVNRAECHLAIDRPGEAIKLHERALPRIPAAYVRDRAAACSRLAAAYAANGSIEESASTILSIVPAARHLGSWRILHEISRVAASLAPHRDVPVVAEMLETIRRRTE